MWNKGQSTMVAHINDAISCLKKLPKEYQENDFEKLLDQLVEDLKHEQEVYIQKFDSQLEKWHQLSGYLYKMNTQRDLLLEYYVQMKMKQSKDFINPQRQA